LLLTAAAGAGDGARRGGGGGSPFPQIPKGLEGLAGSLRTQLEPEKYNGPSKGETVGKVARVMSASAFVVQAGDNERIMFSPRWIGQSPKDGGGYDKEVREKIGALKEGDEVKVEWVWEERHRALSIQVLGDKDKGGKGKTRKNG